VYRIKQKGDTYTKLFGTLSGVIHICDILSQLNILCSSGIKLYITKMTIHPLFTIHILQPFHVFSNILDLIEAGESIHQNVQYFIWSKKILLYRIFKAMSEVTKWGIVGETSA